MGFFDRFKKSNDTYLSNNSNAEQYYADSYYGNDGNTNIETDESDSEDFDYYIEYAGAFPDGRLCFHIFDDDSDCAGIAVYCNGNVTLSLNPDYSFSDYDKNTIKTIVLTASEAK